MRRLTLAALTVVALALTGLGIAPAQAATATTGKVAVTVTGPGNVKIPGVSVSLDRQPSGDDDYDYDGDYGTSGTNGVFTSGELTPGSYKVSANIYWPVTSSATKTVTVTASSDAQVTINLTGFSIITGTVKANSVGVSAGNVSASGGAGNFDADVTNGAYTMLVKPGTYTVQVTPPWDATTTTYLATYSGNTVRTPDATTVKVAVGKSATVNIAAYAKVGKISGKIVDAKGKPVAGAQVSTYATNRAGYGYATTAANGSYTLTGLPAGRYAVSAYTSDGSQSDWASTKTVTVKARATTNAGKLVIRKHAEPKGKIVLKIKASAAVWKRGSVCATAYTSKGLYAGGACATQKTKKLTITGLAAGTYKVALDGTNTSQRIVVKKNKTTTKTATRATGTTISGTVKNAKGKVVSKGYVTIRDANGTYLGGVTTSTKGKFSVKGAVSGAYTVVATSPKTADGARTEKTITVKKGKKASASVKLVKGAKITGKVTNSKGKGIKGVNVSAWSADGDWGSAVTNAKGEYTLAALVKGSYTVTARDPYAGGYVDGKAAKAKVATGKSKKAATIRLGAG